MKPYDISFENCTITLSANFLRKASTLGTKEYYEMLQLRRELPGFRFEKAATEKKAASKYKNLTYKHMREYITASFANEADAKAMLDQMKKVEALSKVQVNPYKYVHDWFIKQFPECNRVQLVKNSEEESANQKAAS